MEAGPREQFAALCPCAAAPFFGDCERPLAPHCIAPFGYARLAPVRALVRLR